MTNRYFVSFISIFAIALFFRWTQGHDRSESPPKKSSLTQIPSTRIQTAVERAMELGDQRGIALLEAMSDTLRLSQSISDTSLAFLFHKTGVLSYINSDYTRAIYWFEKALPIRKLYHHSNQEALLNTLNGLTQAHLLNYQYDQAEERIEEQLSLLENSSSSLNETKADLYFADAQLAFIIEDYKRCREKLILADNLYRSIGGSTFNYGLTLNLLGAVSDLIDQPDQSLPYYQQALELFTEQQERHFIALTYHNMGMAYAAMNQSARADSFLNLAYTIHAENNDSVEMARNAIELAKLKISSDHLKEAELLATQSLDWRITHLPEWHPDVIESMLVLGSIHENFYEQKTHDMSNSSELALQYYEKAYRAALASPRPEKALEPLVKKASLYKKLGEVHSDKARIAHGLFQKADSLIRLSRLQLRHQESKIEFTRKIRRTYEQAVQNALHLYQISKDEIYFEAALSFCDRSKSTAVRDKLHKQTVQRTAGLPDSLVRKEHQFQLKLGALTQSLLNQKNTSDSSYFEKMQKLEAIKFNMEELDEEIEKKYPRYSNWLKESGESISLQDLQSTLSSDHILIEYFWGEEEIVVFGLSRDDFTYWRKENPDVLHEVLSDFILSVEAQKNGNVICQKAYPAYQLLLEDGLNYFNRKNKITHLTIVPDGPIGKTPFDALISRKTNQLDAGTPFLVKEYSHHFLYSHRLLTRQESPSSPGRNQKIAVIGIDYSSAAAYFSDSAYTTLPFIHEETRQVKKITGGNLFLNNEATVERMQTELADSDILHVAVHGSYDEENPGKSGLILSKPTADDPAGNLLSLAAIYGLQAKARFIYLSSCYSGKGRLSRGEGVLSLSRAFTYAGVTSQVITLWEVSDRASATIAGHFYSFLKKGETKDEALRKAKLAYLEESATSVGQNPYFWAGSIVVGNTEALYSGSGWLTGLIIGLGLLAGLLLLLKIKNKHTTSSVR